MAIGQDAEIAAQCSLRVSTTSHSYGTLSASPASSACSSFFSIDAPSSQSSVASASSSGSLSANWNTENESENESVDPHTHRVSQGLTSVASKEPIPVCAESKSCKSYVEQISAEANKLESRQQTSRTRRSTCYVTVDGKAVASCPRQPPALIRQSERKDNFVDNLVDTTTQMIECIWPLSVLSFSRESTFQGKDQNLIGLRTFVQEVLRRSKTSYSTLQVALYYLVLIQHRVPKHDFTMEQPVDSQSCRAMQCGRRMFLAALILASKYLQDRNFSARAWSKISGLRTCEINTNEMAFLLAVNWKLHIPEPVFNRWTHVVLKFSTSTPMTPPRSSPSSPGVWKSIVPHLTPDLGQVDFGIAALLDEPGYNSPCKSLTSPSLPTFTIPFKSPSYRETAPTNPSTATKAACEPTVEESDLTPQVLPSLPRLRLLPTPTMTPQTGAFSTPAARTLGLCVGKSSMSAAMAQIQENCLARSTLDNPPHSWDIVRNQPFPTSARRSSLAQSSSTISSPESLISDVSSRSSRSSSISSVASSTNALFRPRLAIQATRRYAKMQLSISTKTNVSVRTSPCEDNRGSVVTASPDALPTTEEDFFVPHPYRSPLDSGSAPGCKNTCNPNASAREAAAALRDLALSRQRNLSCMPSLPASRKREYSQSSDNPTANSIRDFEDMSSQTSPYPLVPPMKCRKRNLDRLSDISVQSSVRDLIAPRCLGDLPTRSIRREDESIVLPDSNSADSFLMPARGDHTFTNEMSKLASMGDFSARKRVHYTGEQLHCLVEERMTRPAPGMWDGII